MKNIESEEILDALNATLTKWKNITQTDGNKEFNEGVCCGITIALEKITRLIGKENEVD